ncbi:MAG TPA: alpha-L-arabinofuranosidase C-terminal domain-containing protein, partial [Bryobacteraceae bacterium]|nr:alpha-L-arabinofuranosidase C-terminal domain-containing protein [Bryobacteraceae bacterium]
DYHWRNGIGPVEKRPKIVNIHWGNYVEDNSFGTHEFIGLCRLIGAEPYIAGNVGSGTPQELRDWVEYCNYPSGSSLADERAANGSPEPFRVRYWGIGNENWGCGGNMTPEEYAAHYRRYATFVRPMGDTRPFPIACGPSSNNRDWTRGFFSSMPARRGGPGPGRGPAPGGPTSGFAMHFYIRGPVLPTKFNANQLREQLARFADLERAIVEQRALMDTFDPNRLWGLIVDEWGVWDAMDAAEEKQFGRLWMQSTMRTAVAGALGLNVFHRQADKLYMCNIAQTVNVLQSVILAHGNDCIRTSTYYAFQMQKPHRGKIAVRAHTGDPSPLGLSVSASKGGGELVATFVNPREDVHLKVNCGVTGAKLLSG